MGLASLFGNIYKKADNRTLVRFKHSRKEDEDYINSFADPVDDIERSFNQYLCQKRNDSDALKYFAANIAAMLAYIPFLLSYRIKRKKVRFQKHYNNAVTRDFLEPMVPDVFGGECICQDFNEGSLSKEDSNFIREVRRRYPISFYFSFKCMCRVASYSDLIKKYNPKTIFCSAEYSFTSSILTKYCENNNTAHINLMHGEKLFNPREAFSRFTEFYVWDEDYIDIFTALRADKTRYIVNPMKLPDIEIETAFGKCVYYLQLQTRDQLIKIKETLEKTGLDYKVRPHPVYDTSATEEIFTKDKIENYKDVDIWESIAKGGLVISIDSTVLYQAYLKGVDIIIDDISNPDLYNELADRGYIMLDKPHRLLSELIKEK